MSASHKWVNLKSKPTYGHTFSEHGQKLKQNQLADRARAKGHQVGQYRTKEWLNKYIVAYSSNNYSDEEKYINGVDVGYYK
ncbi:hypothetical protein [Xenorhabdus littoralis]|uniref:hypothetical protein n=1 Tax=Xenorhabdus littoralis TaxID=2582835 RepID=UPI0029E8276B|nr:hypothetical protein [Xenorhabdus sp. psl]